MKNHKWKVTLFSFAVFLTVIARNYAVARRLSMGLSPSWGGEFMIIPLFLLAYFAITADWSID